VSGKVAPMIFQHREATYLGGIGRGAMTRSNSSDSSEHQTPADRAGARMAEWGEAVDPKVQTG